MRWGRTFRLTDTAQRWGRVHLNKAELPTRVLCRRGEESGLLEGFDLWPRRLPRPLTDGDPTIVHLIFRERGGKVFVVNNRKGIGFPAHEVMVTESAVRTAQRMLSAYLGPGSLEDPLIPLAGRVAAWGTIDRIEVSAFFLAELKHGTDPHTPEAGQWVWMRDLVHIGNLSLPMRLFLQDWQQWYAEEDVNKGE